MTFLNPFVLLGLAAAALPVIIHLLNRRKLKIVEFSSLRFLKELQQTSIRRLRLRQLILLILRMLLIVALVLAFSRPALRGTLAGAVGSRALTTLIIILDDSPSMTVRNDRGMLFTQAKEAAARILDLAKEGDRIYLSALSGLRRGEKIPPLEPLASARARLGRMVPATESVDVVSALKAIQPLLASSRDPNRELYLISDGQATQFTGPPDTTGRIDPDVRVFFVKTDAGRQENAGVASVDIATRILTTGRPVQIQALIRNYGSLPLQGSLMSVYLDGVRVVQQIVDIAPRAASTQTFTILPKRQGLLTGYVQIEDDALEIDNTRHFVLTIPERLNVIAVGPAATDTRLPVLALTLAGDTSMSSLFSVQRLEANRFEFADFTSADLLILSGVKSFSPALSGRIAAFVRSGGGLLLFPGRENDVQNYNATLFQHLGIPPVSQSPAAGPAGYLSFGRIDYAHPILSGLFDTSRNARGQKRSVESPHVFRSLVIHAGGTGSPVIELSNGDGFLVDFPVGNGRVLLCAVDAGLESSDFPVKAIFAPLVHRSALYLAAQQIAAPPVVAGNTLRLSMRTRLAPSQRQYVLQAPSGLEERIAPHVHPASGTVEFESAPTAETGVYTLRAGGADNASGQRVLAAAVVSAESAESDLRPAETREMNAFWSERGVAENQFKELTVDDALEHSIQQSRFGTELWRYALALAFLLALAEMAIGREKK